MTFLTECTILVGRVLLIFVPGKLLENLVREETTRDLTLVAVIAWIFVSELLLFNVSHLTENIE